MVLGHVFDQLGNTPALHIPVPELEGICLYAKLELTNPTGSVKDRAAAYILQKGLQEGFLTPETLIIESSSGNFGIALAAACKRRGLRFCCVIDPRINAINETLIRGLGAEVVKVSRLDPTGGYLQTRIKTVGALLEATPNSYWVNQYENPLNAEAYEETLGAELIRDFERIDYLFCGVSSGGTITGLSNKLKRHFPNLKVVAVDAAGSIIFGGPAQARWIPGIGASIRPKILDRAKIDDVVTVAEVDTVAHCHELWAEHGVLAGGSSGTVFAAVRTYFRERPPMDDRVVVTLFADRGDRYADTIYDNGWVRRLRDGTLRRSIPAPAGDSTAPPPVVNVAPLRVPADLGR